jgi:hypothetical protein
VELWQEYLPPWARLPRLYRLGALSGTSASAQGLLGTNSLPIPFPVFWRMAPNAGQMDGPPVYLTQAIPKE